LIEQEYGIVNSFKTYYFNTSKLPVLKSKIDALAYQVKIRDHLLDLPEKTIIKRRVRMSEEQQAHYEEMFENLSTMLDDQFISVDEKLTRLTKLRQITGGFLIDQEKEAHLIKSATKLGELDELVEEIGISKQTDTKVVIYAQYQWEIETIEARYKDKGSVSVYGGNNTQTNLNNIKLFISDPEIKIIVLHPRSAAHGITLTVSHYMIFYSISYSSEENYQCIARIERASQKHPMFIYYLLSKHFKNSHKKMDTIDETIYKVLMHKEKNQAELIDQKTVSTEILAAFTH
jgi:SNF2 family DNA or RNA helicase